MKIINRILVVCVSILLVSCGAKKMAVKDNAPSLMTPSDSESAAMVHQLAFVQKVSDTKVYARNIVADMSFTAKMGDKDISVPGALRMKKDEVIRLQLFIPLLGSEIGRLEFTPDYVLVIDRMHKQYVKADYNQLDFLRDNGLNFYSLQSLFWNQLLLPGATKVSESDLQKFDVKLDGTAQNVPVTLKNGNMNYVWMANRESGLIGETTVTYTDARHGKSDLTWKYGDFRPLGAKKFPAFQEFSFTSTAINKVQKTTVTLDMGDIKTTDGWETRTTVSDKYKQMDAKEILGKLLNM